MQYIRLLSHGDSPKYARNCKSWKSMSFIPLNNSLVSVDPVWEDRHFWSTCTPQKGYQLLLTNLSNIFSINQLQINKLRNACSCLQVYQLMDALLSVNVSTAEQANNRRLVPYLSLPVVLWRRDFFLLCVSVAGPFSPAEAFTGLLAPIQCWGQEDTDALPSYQCLLGGTARLNTGTASL